MKIFVKSRLFISNIISKNPDWILDKWIISIFDQSSFSPISQDRYNILKLEFDDVTEKDTEPGLLHFNSDLAKQIVDFIKPIKANDTKPFYVHCAAGVSRSGAVGYMLNEWFNKYLTTNRLDNEAFIMNNSHILPNPEVVRILKQEMFGSDYRGVFVNDYVYNEDGERQDNIKEI